MASRRTSSAYWHDEPVQACPPSAGYRFRKFVRRNKAPVVAASLLVLALVVGMVGTKRGQIRADSEKAQPRRNSRKARAVVDRMFTKVALDLAYSPRMEKVRRELLVDALELYQGFLKENGTNPTLRYEAALANIKVGEIHGVLSELDLAEEAWRQSIATLEKLSTQFPQVPEYRENLAYCFEELGETLARRGRHKEAINESRAQVDLRQKLASDFPTVPDFRRKLALAHTDLGNRLMDLERLDEAEHHFRQARMRREKLRADFPEVPEDRKGLAHIHNGWGNLHLRTIRLPEAEQEFRKVLALRERLVADELGNSELKSLLANNYVNLGYVLLLQRRKLSREVLAKRLVGEAENLFRRSIHLSETLIEDFPDTPDHHRRLAGGYLRLSEPLMQMGRVQEAIGAIRRSISEEEKWITYSPPRGRSSNPLDLLPARFASSGWPGSGRGRCIP